MKQPTDKLRTNVGGMLVAVIGFMVVAYYAVTAIGARDAFWFWSGFEDKPVRMIVYEAGQQTELLSGDPGFAELAEAVRASLASGVARTSGMGLSAGSLEDAYKLYVTLEVFFDGPVKLHAAFNTGHPQQMLFPITGRHSDLNVVFLGVEGVYMSGAPVLNTTEPIRKALQAAGFSIN
jgi:hypothetical protein